MRRIKLPSTAQRVIYLLIAVLLPTMVVIRVSAQTGLSWFGMEAEQGSLSGQAQVLSDGSASGASAVLFNSSQAISLPNPGSWSNATGNLASMPSECGNLTLVSAYPKTNKVIAGVAQKGLWYTTNGGTSWTQMGTGAGSAVIVNRPSSLSFDPANSSIFYESGIYNGGGVYKTVDGGTTFTQLGTIGHIDYVSVDYGDPNRQTLIAGGHEQSQSVWKSTNGGQTWTNVGTNLPAGTAFSSAPIIINSNTYVVSAIQSWGGGVTGMYRTTNGGTTWTKVSDIAATGTPPTVTSSGVIYWPTGGNLAKSSDGGATWTTVGNGNIQNGRVTELQDGRIVAANGQGTLTVTADGGATWTGFGASMPFNINDRGVTYSPTDAAFFIWQWDCGGSVLPNAIQRLK